ncbi:trifunctional serine/threonine-protein kinase/ATP-binding protein/sensor histidine kinase [Mastigocladopsis repens]|uniref:trifunctional serine/threonine-protein kinase/ATP-binding protein/sensor histidine kinase n=1 Tax=Mastigocladopsis repens TaxID=221287 RepID=UPI000319375D|nr:AAA family ATPase [Mastigocladopsis repens]
MINVPGYQILAQIYESANSLVYRGIREQDNKVVILKVLKEDYPTPEELRRYKQEYCITCHLNCNGAIQAYGIENYHRTLVIILEDFGASSLNMLMRERDFTLAECLNIAIAVTESLSYIHAANIIHKDINPSNIVLNPETGLLKIIDFGIATVLTRENPTFKNPNVIEGTLAYMSPEQIGRMNRTLDYRTDFYSLGVTFYKLLTKQLPFTTDDVLELVHCHIAKQPPPPHIVNSEIPLVVSDIVMKLMAKNAEQRYQSAWGLLADLHECITQLQASGTICEFPLATQDISDKFHIPQKLYGREAEVRALLAAFERVATDVNLTSPRQSPQWEEPSVPPAEEQRLRIAYIESTVRSEGNPRLLVAQKSQTPAFPSTEGRQGGLGRVEMMLVAGYSGIGKSALVQEIYKPITSKRGYFISGKFDQFGRNIPYSAIVSAFKELVRQLLTETEDLLQHWREKILAAVGPYGQVIIDVIPEVELIIGKQPDVPEVEPTESQNRFNRVFQNFIRVFCAKEHPLVIFLDDLQWVDSATLKLIELMMTDSETQYLFLIGAYRDNEVNATHLLMMTLEKLRKQGQTINSITLAPLGLESISQLIAETLHSDISTVRPLAELVLRKTFGNPFFVNEFLKTLHTEYLITFNFAYHRWEWNLAQIEAKDITDNVVELMIGKLKKLPESTQQVLRLAACVGAQFDLNTLCVICEKSTSEIFSDLVTAVQAGLILPTSELDKDLFIQNYKFLHDRVQQAAYALIDENQKQAVHLQIGRNLLQKNSPQILFNKLFEIVDHLNFGVALVTHQAERDEIARLNLMAGQKAKAAVAYVAAVRYLTVGMEFLAINSWQTNYELTLALYVEATEAAYLSLNFEQMEQWATVVLQQAKNLLDKVKVYEVKIQSSRAQRQQLQALKIGLQVLELLGVALPSSPTQSDVQQALLETKLALSGKNIQDLSNLPPMTDANKLASATMRILNSLLSSAYQAAPALYPLLACKQVNLSLKHGNAPLSAIGYAMYGVILNGVVQDVEGAEQFGSLALSLIERFNANSLKNKALLTIAGCIIHGKHHVRESISLAQEAYSSAVENGDFEMAAYAAAFECSYSYLTGLELTKLEQKIANYNDAFPQLKQEMNLSHQICHQVVINLLERTENPCHLLGEEQLLPLLLATERCSISPFYVYKLMLCFLFGELTEALKNAASAEQYLHEVPGVLQVPLFHFYDSLVQLAVYPSVPYSEQEQLLLKVTSHQEKMLKWAHHAPMNFQHKYDLVEAEKARVLGQVFEAEEFYERAIQGANDNEYIQEEALAYELAAKFYLARAREKIARTYMQEAHYCYRRWGATAKVKDLEAKYPQLLTKSPVVSHTQDTRITNPTTTTASRSKEGLDLATVMKASLAISGEIVLDKLLSSLMKILIENAGAQKGFLILETSGQLLIEASGEVNSSIEGNTYQTKVLQSIPIDNRLPASIINYVVRTKESVVLNDATSEGNFTLDLYIQQHQTKSVLCAPLVNQGQLQGIIYLENNLITNAFTPNELKFIKILSSQAAISIENARLYNNLEEYNRTLETKVEERTQELSQALEHLKATQEELIQSEKMAALGQLIAGVAHEINTPLGVIRSCAGNISNFLNQTLLELPSLFQSLSVEQKQDFLALVQKSITRESTFSAREERQFKRNLIHQLEELKIENADTLADTLTDMRIYHDINAFLPLLERPDSLHLLNIAYKLSGLYRGTQTINTAIDRAAKVVFALKTYARYDSSGEMTPAHLSEGIETVLTLYHNQFKRGVEVKRNYADLPAVLCYPDELNQVWTNLIHNALQAMENQGTLTIDVTLLPQSIKISMTDTGKGIPPEIQSKIFEPFFTTKPLGEGSGLGLYIVKKIVEKHSGNITVESQPGRTSFHVFLPVQPI